MTMRVAMTDVFATKADLAQMETKLTKWMLGVMAGAVTLGASIATAVAFILR